MGNCLSEKGGPEAAGSKVQPKLKSKEKQGAKEMRQIYQIDNKTKVLGSGNFGKVFLTHNKKFTDFQVAIKVLNKGKLQDQIGEILREVDILTKLDHPNIVKYYETYDDDKYLYLVMEYIGGGELFEHIYEQKNQVFSEEVAKKYIKTLFEACCHMHSQGIVHRDIKPENIMLSKTGELKIIDFGLSKQQAKEGQKLKTIAGTPYYMAPEIMDGHYDSKVDSWSLGVLIYVFMSGYMPFKGSKRYDIFSKIQSGNFNFDHPEFEKCSNDVKNLIS